MWTGWIKLHRQILDWEWYGDVACFRVFIHLLLTANTKQRRWKGMDIQRGQSVVSLGNLAEDTGLSVQQVRTAIKKLKATNEITTEATNRCTLVTIQNYDSYQVSPSGTNKPDNKADHMQVTFEKHADNKEATIHKEEQNTTKKEEKMNHKSFTYRMSPSLKTKYRLEEYN